jgi:hypothetical protein
LGYLVVWSDRNGNFVDCSATSTANHWTNSELVAYLAMTVATNENVVGWLALIHVVAGAADKNMAVSSNNLLQSTPFAVYNPNLQNMYISGTLVR